MTLNYGLQLVPAIAAKTTTKWLDKRMNRPNKEEAVTVHALDGATGSIYKT